MQENKKKIVSSLHEEIKLMIQMILYVPIPLSKLLVCHIGC